MSPQARKEAAGCSSTLSPAEDPNVPEMGPLAEGKLSWVGPQSGARVGCYPSASRGPHRAMDGPPCGGRVVNRVPVLSLVEEMECDHSFPLGSEDDYEGLQVAVRCSAPSFQHSLAQGESASIFLHEIYSLLNKGVICVDPPALCHSGFYFVI